MRICFRCRWSICTYSTVLFMYQLYPCKQFSCRNNKIFNQQEFIYIFKILKHFSIYNVWCSRSIIFCALSIRFNNRSSGVFKWRGPGKCRLEPAIGGGGRLCWIYCITLKCLPLSHSKRDFDRKSSSPQSVTLFLCLSCRIVRFVVWKG